jgi:colicin import membrane protein
MKEKCGEERAKLTQSMEAQAAARLEAEAKRHAAELEAEAKRHAAEREAEAKRHAAEREAEAKRHAAEVEALNRKVLEEVAKAKEASVVRQPVKVIQPSAVSLEDCHGSC